jgi:hypothetical protein
MAVANTLAYYDTATITVVKSFFSTGPRSKYIRLSEFLDLEQYLSLGPVLQAKLILYHNKLECFVTNSHFGSSLITGKAGS